VAPRDKRLGFLPKWRILSYVIIAFNILMLIWVFSAAGTTGTCNESDPDLQSACETGEAVGTGLAIVLLIFLWAIIDVILGVIFLVTNRSKSRECPACGTDVKKGVMVCHRCGFDFMAAAQGRHASYPS
jgi:hypothetical protein